MNLDFLNERQREAVVTTEGPVLVIAGAGSGKTRVLTTKVAYLVQEKKINPSHILAITFTNKAAKEMKDRVIGMLGSIAYTIPISTFHSFGLQLIKENYEELGYKPNFTIMDSDDTLTIIKKIIKELNYDPKEYNPKAIRNKISGAKNELMNAKEYEKYAATTYEEVVVKVYERYEKKLKANNSFDFDDLLMKPIELFQSHPEILKKYQERFEYILIDEYQDTNQAQYMLTKMLSAKYKNICVVGDDSQAIYAWRGANYKNILNFEKDFKDTKVILLEENYRSTQNILNVANNIIKNNKQKKEKNLWTSNEEGVKIKYHKADNEKDEAFYVTNEIQNLLKKGVKEKEIAVLYRTNAQSRNMEEMLLKENIPYKVVGSFYFYNRKEIKDLICYLKLIYNTNDDISFMRVVNVPKRGIGEKSLESLSIKAMSENTSLFGAITDGKLLSFKHMIEEIQKTDCSLTELVDLILEKTGIKEELEHEKTLEADIRLENLEEFKTITKTFEEKNGIISLEDFLNEISLVSDIEEHKNNTDVVTLMTVHSAKGLEFEHVFLIGMEEGIFPHSNSLMDMEQIEEERRLCYVAVTRAKKTLHLVNARRRTIFGDLSYNMPSRFIDEIDENYLEIDEEQQVQTKTQIYKEDNIDTSIEYHIGEKVEHETFGVGMIVGIETSILTVAFPHPHGIKKLLKGHKTYRKVSGE